ncbi:MAG: ABC transporter ATP-binding protein [Planctomycetes bacterium]|nr:ABC transporter ATP-binding protein [Planctomycetota bacterium]MCP4770108.1 ABC transporter ATP-binding protein [Planctomycetota bacterium]MCP4860744.1 ABC transporter ATP-binding protein [Planctomycetota bacterium]
MGDIAIRCENLSRWYGEVQGLAGLTVTIESGIVGLLGPNGSGKSTLMRLLTGQIKANRGTVEIYGQRITPGTYEIFRRIGHAPGEDVHFETDRAIDFLCLMAALGGDSPAKAKDRSEKALERVGMEKKADVKLNAMSKGMRQRIKIAQALLFEPDLLLLDEPLNGMDPVSRRNTMDLVRDWAGMGRTVVMASHVLHEVEAVTDRMLMLHHGRLLAEGRLTEIRDLIDMKPRRASVRGENLRGLAAEMLAQDVVTGLDFGNDGVLHLDTRDLPTLLDRLQTAGLAGQIHSMEIDDQELEMVYDLLVGGSAR